MAADILVKGKTINDDGGFNVQPIDTGIITVISRCENYGSSSYRCYRKGQQRRQLKRSLMKLRSFERAILIINIFETMHHPNGWLYVGYGHQVQSEEPYRRGAHLTEKQAHALLRKDLRKFCALYSQYGKDSIFLGCLASNCGPGVVNKSSILKKLKAGDRNIFKAYTSTCRFKHKWHKGINTRRLTEFDALLVLSLYEI